MVRKFLSRLVVLVVVFLSASYASATQLAYDGFNYTVPGGLNGQNGGTGFSGAWTAVSGQASPALASGSLTYTSGSNSLATTGNKVAPSSTARSIRNFTSPIATANTTLWLSYRINQTDTGTLPSNHAGFSLFTGAGATGTEILFGKGTSWTNWGMLLSTGPSATKAGSVTAGDRDGFLLYKCVFTSSTVTIQMWVNPSFTEGSLGTAHATLPASAFTGTLACIRLSTGTNSVNYQFDEIRMGTTFTDVVPAVPASVLYAYDGFAYPAPGGLNTQNGGSGFSGAWTAVTGLASPALSTGSLTYTSGSSLATAGNKVQPTAASRSTRNFSSPIATANTTMWLSYRINQTGTGALPTNHAGFSLFTGANATGTEILFGAGSNVTNWGMLISTGGSANKAGSVTAADRNGLLLYKCVFTSSTVTIQMWVNPGFVEGSLGAAHATLPATSYSGSFASLRLSTGTNAANYQFDEIRIGNSFASVMPVASGTTFTPMTAGALTTALGQVQLGDTIILQAGTLYEGSFQLPNLTNGSGYVTIQSSNLASLPAAGTRVNLSHASNMPKIRAANTTSSPFYTATSAHHFKLIGLEITGPVADTMPDGVTDISWAPVQLGTVGTGQDTLAEVPHNFIIDRCIIRANSNTQRIRRGIALHSASTDILNCHISGFKDVDQSDTQAIGGYNGPGPYNIINNYLEAAAENIMFGGDNISIPNQIPTDIVIAKNYFFKPLNWKIGHPSHDGSDWVIKNLMEFKVARNVLVEGNIFENCWNQGQSGYGVTFSVRNQNGANNWAVVENVTYRKNILRNSGGFYFIGTDPNFPSQTTNHITLENNLNYNIDSAFAGTGHLYAFSDGPGNNITINHNTSFHDGNTISGTVSGYSDFVFTNNLQAHNTNGVIAGGGMGAGTLNLFTNLTFQKNVLMDNASHSLNTLLTFYNPYYGGWNPTSLMFPQNGWTGVVVNQASPGSNFAGYKVVGWDQPTNASLYPYNNTGTDGTDIGCNIDEVLAATAGCVSGVWP